MALLRASLDEGRAFEGCPRGDPDALEDGGREVQVIDLGTVEPGGARFLVEGEAGAGVGAVPAFGAVELDLEAIVAREYARADYVGVVDEATVGQEVQPRTVEGVGSDEEVDERLLAVLGRVTLRLLKDRFEVRPALLSRERAVAFATLDVEANSDGAGAFRPTPRKLSPASVRIAEAEMEVACTISGASVLGRMWRKSSFGVLVPPAVTSHGLPVLPTPR